MDKPLPGFEALFKPAALKEKLKAFQVKREAGASGPLALQEWPASVKLLEIGQAPGRTAVANPASAKIAYDSSFLYVLVEVPVKGNLKTEGAWGQVDASEICLRDASGEKPGPIMVLHGFLDCKVEGSSDAGAPQASVAKLASETKVAVKAENGLWRASWAIPFESLGVKAAPGVKLGFNIGVRRVESDDWLILMGTLGPTWRLEEARILALE